MTSSLLAQRYELQRLSGRGHLALIYRAQDTVLQRPVVVKVLRPEYTQDPRFRACFRRSITLAARFRHPNLVTVYDFGEDGERTFVVMEYVPGQTLRHVIDTQAPLPPEKAIALMVQACAGIGYLHRLKLVHGDVRPENMLLTPDGHLKIADFTLVHPAHLPDDSAPCLEPAWTTPQYLSPEQAARHPPVPASDVYALGLVLYELLTRHRPFLTDDPARLAELHRQAPPVPPGVYAPEVPETLERVIMKALAKEPSARYRTADQLGRVLLHFGAPQPTAPHAEPPPPPPPRPAPPPPKAPSPPIDWVTFGLGILAMIAVLGLIPLWMWVYLVYHAAR